MSDEIDLSGVFLRAAVDGDEDAAGVRYDVRVGEDLIFPDEESGADAATKAARVPGCLVVRDLSCSFDSEDGLIDSRGRRRCLRKKRCGGAGQQEEWENQTTHGLRRILRV